MADLFDQGRFTDFGCSAYLPPSPSVSLTRAEASRRPALRREVRLRAPRKPGVYGMLDRQEQLIYVGKAKNLRARLLTYFQEHTRSTKAGKISAQARTVVWEVCPNEFASLLRELELIRRWRPRWNVQGQPLRHRHAFVCLGRAPAPYIFLAGKPPARCLAAYGPIPAGRRAGEAVRRLNDAFRLRDCPQKQAMIFPDQGGLFPETQAPGCLRLEIGTCLGPCTGTCTWHDYQAEVQAARQFLAGEDFGLLQQLEAEMAAAAQALAYEKAAALRDRWQPLHWLAGALERLRFAQEQLSFIYPVCGHDDVTWWYLIHGARPIAAVPAPHDVSSRRLADAAIRRVFRDGQRAALLAPYEHADSMMLVLAWFGRYAAERARVLTPEQALSLCETAHADHTDHAAHEQVQSAAARRSD